ncbi:MAG: 1-deoxy-D-xylulose-5-phosphate reductoisomerase [Clostridia bacterium]|nr:1-deoxy-D-xylulose-5-phosphate reductoisomerase [Clostridia bacterium]
MKRIVILGATGSIGKNTLSVLDGMLDRYEIVGLSAKSNIRRLIETAEKYHVKTIGITDDVDTSAFTFDGRILKGKQCLTELCDLADLVVIAVVGPDGLRPFIHCLKKHITVAFATKEAMVYGGKILRDLIDETGTDVLPLDSEISAIYQALRGNDKKSIKEIYLTASGGPFRTWDRERIAASSLAEALNHPNWSMGRKITVDSATMANKGLEIMETRWFFDVDPSLITVVIHPESIIHSAVKYKDNSVMAQMGETDMRTPIAYALNYPDRVENVSRELDLFSRTPLTFERPDLERFPALKLAMEAVRAGIGEQIVFNASNDRAVELFLQERIGFYDISDIIKRSLDSYVPREISTVDDIFAIDEQVKALVEDVTRGM